MPFSGLAVHGTANGPLQDSYYVLSRPQGKPKAFAGLSRVYSLVHNDTDKLNQLVALTGVHYRVGRSVWVPC